MIFIYSIEEYFYGFLSSMPRNVNQLKLYQPIPIEGLWVNQMKEEFSGDIHDFISTTKEELSKMHPVKSKKIIHEIQNNLQFYVK